MQSHNHLVADGRPLQPITAQLKKQLIEYMLLVPLNTGWGFAVRDFIEKQHEKSNSDYEEILYELRADIQDGPGTMQDILGSAYTFFHTLVL